MSFSFILHSCRYLSFILYLFIKTQKMPYPLFSSFHLANVIIMELVFKYKPKGSMSLLFATMNQACLSYGEIIRYFLCYTT